MYCFIFQMFLTLVITSHIANANPHQDINPAESSQKTKTEVNNNHTDDIDKNNLSINPPPPLPKVVNENYYYPFTQSVSPRLGTMIDSKNFSKDKGNAFRMLYGFNYLFPRFRSPQLEVGADLIKGFAGQIHLSKLWIYNERTSFRNFYKLGATLKAVGSEGFATITNHENYLARASVGFEDYYRKPLSLRLELEFAVGIKDVFIYLTFGYSWGF